MTAGTETDALFTAIADRDRDTVRALVAKDPGLAAARNSGGVSAVLWACYHQEPELATELATAKGELDVFEAAALDQAGRVAALIEADPALLGAYAPDGYHALGLAAFFGAPNALRVLLDAGADPNQVADNAMRVTALHAAAAARRVDLVRALLACGADPNARQQGGWTPLHEAVHHEDDAMAEVLRAAGADAEARNDDGLTPEDVRGAGPIS